MLGVAPGPPVGQDTRRHHGKPQRLVEFPIGQETGIAGDLGTVELELQATVENHSESAFSSFTHQILPIGSRWSRRKPLFMGLIQGSLCLI